MFRGIFWHFLTEEITEIQKLSGCSLSHLLAGKTAILPALFAATCRVLAFRHRASDHSRTLTREEREQRQYKTFQKSDTVRP